MSTTNLGLASKLAVAASLVLALLLCGGCRNAKTAQDPSTAFTSYVYAYTGGTISTDSAVRIEFASEVDSSVDPSTLFSFSPSLKGTANWVSNTCVEFIPEDLKQGQTYKASFRLGDVTKVSDASLNK